MRTIVFLALAFAHVPLWAQPAGEPPAAAAPRADFAALDRNKDGYLSRLEAASDREIAKRFATFDADADGRLSESEYIYAKQDNDRRILRDTALTRLTMLISRSRRLRARIVQPQRAMASYRLPQPTR